MGEMISISCEECGLESSHLIGSGEAGIEYILCSCASCARFVDIERSVISDDPMPALVCPHCDGAGSVVTIDWGVRSPPPGSRLAQAIRNSGAEPRPSRPPAPVSCPSCGQDVVVTPAGLWD